MTDDTEKKKEKGREPKQEPAQKAPQAAEPQKNEAEEYKEKWLRAQADYQNLQKEIAKEKSRWIAMSEYQILSEFIPVYEHFKKAFESRPGSGENGWENWAQGVGFIKKQFEDILRAHGVEEMNTVGESFDAARHEAMGEEESDTVEDGHIIREVSGGYLFKNEVVVPAKVIVCRKGSSEPGPLNAES